MPKRKQGLHNLHVRIDEQRFRLLQQYCAGGIEKITASSILNQFLLVYVDEHVAPRMGRGEVASHNALRSDLPSAAKLVGQKLHPGDSDD